MTADSLRSTFVGAALLALAPAASAQLNTQWVTFQAAPERLVTQTPLTTSDTESDVDWGDLDQDGWVDMAVVRKEHFTTTGKRPNVLLMNELGVLTDRSALFASAASVPGDQGFLTPTNDRDVTIADLDNDGWLDLVTATTRSDGDPKHLGHPRVYLNLGEDANGNWLGLRFENGRYPQLFNSSGQPRNPSFCGVDAGDVTDDGFADLYFGDYGSAMADLDDRLCVNDGTGFFTDDSLVRMTPAMLQSAFSAAVNIADMNGDGTGDIVKQSALGAPQHVSIAYNRPSVPGFFQIYHGFHAGFAPYHVNVGDFNADGKLDVITSDDSSDRYRLNQGNDALGRVIWGPAKVFTFLAGGDEGFGSNNLIADLDGDGFGDGIVCNVDVDIPNYGGRIQIYHNLGGPVGGDVSLREERQFSNDSGWVGAVGLTVNDLRNGHDIAVFDVDNDGDNDLFLSRREANVVWVNQKNPILCQADLGSGGPGATKLSVCGQPLWSGNDATLVVADAPPAAPVFLALGLSQLNLPLFGGTLVPLPDVAVIGGLVTSGAGTLTLPITGGGTALDVFAQAIVLDLAQPELFQLSNAVRVEFH